MFQSAKLFKFIVNFSMHFSIIVNLCAPKSVESADSNLGLCSADALKGLGIQALYMDHSLV